MLLIAKSNASAWLAIESNDGAPFLKSGFTHAETVKDVVFEGRLESNSRKSSFPSKDIAEFWLSIIVVAPWIVTLSCALSKKRESLVLESVCGYAAAYAYPQKEFPIATGVVISETIANAITTPEILEYFSEIGSLSDIL